MIQKQYNSFIKNIQNDYPYQIKFPAEFLEIFETVYDDVICQHSKIKNKFYSIGDDGILDFKFLDHYLIFCYRISNYIFKNKMDIEMAEAIYYSSRFRTSTDLYYRAEIGEYFMPVHSMGAIIDSHAIYGKLFKVYNGVHIGPHNIIGVDAEDWKHPKFDDGVTLLANSSVYGNSVIGKNVVVSVGTTIINEEIPDNCIVLGQSPNLRVMPLNVDNFEILK